MAQASMSRAPATRCGLSSKIDTLHMCTPGHGYRLHVGSRAGDVAPSLIADTTQPGQAQPTTGNCDFHD